MTIKRVRPKMAGALDLKRLSRRDFLKVGGTGLAGAALLGTAGCGSIFGGGQDGGNGGGGENNESITLNLQDTVRDLNSTTTTDSVSTDILLNVIEGLYRLDVNQKPEPAMAEGVEVSDDQLTYTFTLKDGIQWSNGDPVTAQDFEFAWLRALNPDTAGQYAFIIAQFVSGGTPFNAGEGSREDVGIRATDDKTLEVELEAPTPFFLSLTSFFTYLPQNQRFVEEQGDNYAQNAGGLLYNGAYTLNNFNPTSGVTFVKNEDYWDADNVDIERVEAKIVKQLDTAVNLHQSGELDITEISQEFVDQFRDSPDFQSQTNFACFNLSFNFDVPVFQNANVRKAFQMGVDYEALTQQILNDGSEPATGWVPAGIAGPENQTFREAQGSVVPSFDAQEAKRLFEQGIEEVGSNPTIELLSYDTDTAQATAEFLQAQFEDNLGAKINVTIQPFDRKLELEANGEFQLSFQGWIGDYNDPMTFLDLWLSDASFNTGKYQSDRYDELITQAQAEADPAARMDLMLEAERLLVEEDAALAPMFFEGEVRLISPFIKDFISHPYGAGIDIKLWKVEK